MILICNKKNLKNLRHNSNPGIWSSIAENLPLWILHQNLINHIMKIGLFHGSKLDQIYLCSIDKSWEKGDFENPKVINRNFSTKSVPD